MTCPTLQYCRAGQSIKVCTESECSLTRKTYQARFRQVLKLKSRYSSFGLRKGTDEFNKGSANWFLFDREKAAHKGGALTGTEERYDCVLR